ncbi:MAG: helix-turn-helix transcriptional regulator [Oscillospiraceae bacterium]|nr:helix-turn-helix transcriptional regulator [Oscillospiraceae bacterium]
MKLNIGANIRKRRREAGLTQEELGTALGVSPQAISRWENGTSYPDIEFLPTLAKYFGVSVDVLLGYKADGIVSRLGELLREFSEESHSEKPNIEHVVGIIREMRRDYLSCIDDYFWWEARTLYRLPLVLPELRKTAEAILEQCTNRHLREYAIYHMAQYEDDAHIEVFLEKYAQDYDLTYKNLRSQRYICRREKEKQEVMRQLRFCHTIHDLTETSFLPSDSALMPVDRALSAEEHLRVNTFQLGVLNRLCGVQPTEVHPIFCDGVMDEWSVLRVGLGVQRTGYLASTGDTEGAFAVLEDVVSMYERIVRRIVKDGGWETDIQVRCPWLDKAEVAFRRNWIHEDRRLLSEEWIIGGQYQNIYDSVDLYFLLTSDGEYCKWFEPIRNDPRYQVYVDRIAALAWNHEGYQALYQRAMEQRDSGMIAPNSCLVCMLSEKGNLHHLSFPITAEWEQILPLLTELVPEQDSVMSVLLCFLTPEWAPEIPSYAFRKALLQLNEANQKTIIFMNGYSGLIEKPLAATMPPAEKKAEP